MDKPLISVITIAMNVKDDLVRSVLSVRAQTGVVYEHIVIDGGSTDGTVDWLRQDGHPNVQWISEPDKGIYDAMNKGIDRAQGDWLYFLSGGDQVLPGVFERVAPLLTPDLDALVGNIRQTDGGRFYGTFSEAMLISNLIHHQAAFYNRRLFANYRYDPALRAMSDYELNLLLYLQHKHVRVVDIDMGLCDMTGISSGLFRSLMESHHVKVKHMGVLQASRYSLILAWKYLVIYLKRIKRELTSRKSVKIQSLT